MPTVETELKIIAASEWIYKVYLVPPLASAFNRSRLAGTIMLLIYLSSLYLLHIFNKFTVPHFTMYKNNGRAMILSSL